MSDRSEGAFAAMSVAAEMFEDVLTEIEAAETQAERDALTVIALDHMLDVTELTGYLRALQDDDPDDRNHMLRVSGPWRNAVHSLIGIRASLPAAPMDKTQVRVVAVRLLLDLAEDRYHVAAARMCRITDAEERAVLQATARDAAFSALQLLGELRALGHAEDASRLADTWTRAAAAVLDFGAAADERRSET